MTIDEWFVLAIDHAKCGDLAGTLRIIDLELRPQLKVHHGRLLSARNAARAGFPPVRYLREARDLYLQWEGVA